jgi:hypothetical protein
VIPSPARDRSKLLAIAIHPLARAVRRKYRSVAIADSRDRCGRLGRIVVSTGVAHTRQRA